MPALEPEVAKRMRVLPMRAYYVSTYKQDWGHTMQNQTIIECIPICYALAP